MGTLGGDGMIVAAIAVVVVVCVIAAVIVFMKHRGHSEDVRDESAAVKTECSESEPEHGLSKESETTVKPSEEQKEPEPESPKAVAFIKPCTDPKPSETAQPIDEKGPAINNDFLSKLVPSKDACEKAAEIPITRTPDEPVAAAEVVEETVQSAESSTVPEGATEPEQAAEAGSVDVDAETSGEDDIYTDYSPEALVRRAAWNKGLRCRRQYGEHAIQVAFVKPKVAVYVLEQSDVITDEDKIKEEGWTLLRFDASKVTDGLSEGDEIAEAVKANLHAQKASKKKSGKK